MSRNLFVGNLASEVSVRDLEDNFKQIGEVVSATVIKDKYSGQSKGFGFVEMATEEVAQDAIQKFNGSELYERKITVSEARPRAEQDKPSRSGHGKRGRS
ncbi:MAG: RNA-binding protein [Syntrophales bacterium LBB04]|nr:RNA-binding protein [Syntrophales bacterium LBB04]